MLILEIALGIVLGVVLLAVIPLLLKVVFYKVLAPVVNTAIDSWAVIESLPRVGRISISIVALVASVWLASKFEIAVWLFCFAFALTFAEIFTWWQERWEAEQPIPADDSKSEVMN